MANSNNQTKDNLLLNFSLFIIQVIMFIFSLFFIFFANDNYILFSFLSNKYDFFALPIHIITVICIPVISFILSILIFFILSKKKTDMQNQIITNINLNVHEDYISYIKYLLCNYNESPNTYDSFQHQIHIMISSKISTKKNPPENWWIF